MVFMVQEWDLVVKVANSERFYRAKVDNIVIGRWILGSKLDLGPKVGSDKVGLGPKVGSDREKPWFSWSKSGTWAESWI